MQNKLMHIHEIHALQRYVEWNRTKLTNQATDHMQNKLMHIHEIQALQH